MILTNGGALGLILNRLLCYLALCCEFPASDRLNGSLSSIDNGENCTSSWLRLFERILANPYRPNSTMAEFGSTADEDRTGPLKNVEDVEIDDSGKFKYVLIKVHWTRNADSETSKYIVRGHKWAGYHVDVYDATSAQLHKMGLDAECVGGGRILHEPQKKSILVYGYSQGYGRADHSIAVELLKKHYPDYTDITWSNEGY